MTVPQALLIKVPVVIQVFLVNPVIALLVLLIKVLQVIQVLLVNPVIALLALLIKVLAVTVLH